MSKANGRRARAIQGLAAALQECLDSAVESSARQVRQEVRAEIGPRFDSAVESSARQVRQEVRADIGPRFDRQDATLRLMWRQCGGDPDRRLPIDD